MLDFTCALRSGVVYIPTSGKVHDGYYIHMDPVEVAPVSDRPRLRKALSAALARGNPIYPSSRSRNGESPILKYAPFETMKEFHEGAVLWSLVKKHSRFEIRAWKPGRQGGFDPDRSRHETFPAGTDQSVACERIIDLLQASAAR